MKILKKKLKIKVRIKERQPVECCMMLCLRCPGCDAVVVIPSDSYSCDTVAFIRLSEKLKSRTLVT